MAVRRESVLLELQDEMTRPLLKSAAAVAVLRKEVDSLNGTAVQTSRSTDKISKDVEKVGKSSDASGKQIDKLSGRLRLLADAALTIGPALVPLGAGTLPAIAGLTAQLGSAVAGIGVAVLAFKGMGDAIGALNDYQLEPTAENLQAMRIEMEKLGPSGAHFVSFLDSLGPELSALQFAARDGLLPGLEDGITSLTSRLPEVTTIVQMLASAMGQLSADAGADLASDEWTAFFDYLRTDAAPTLTSLGNSIGNFAQGFANIFVGLSPASRDFTNGLEEMSQRFAEWSTSLEDNRSFQDFLSYIRESGPQALALVGSMASAFASIAEAAAPIGSITLPALTNLVEIIGVIAGSPLGPVFLAAAAGVTAYNRAALLAAAASTRLSGAMVAATGSASLTAASFGTLAAQAGILGAAAAQGLEAFGRTNDLLAGRDAADATATSYDELAASLQASNIGRHASDLGINVQMLAQDLYENGKAGAYVTQVMGDLDKSSSGVGAAFKEAGSIIIPGWTAASVHAYDAQNDLSNIISNNTGLLGENGRAAAMTMGDLLGLQNSLIGAAHGAQEFSGALAELNGWLDKRAALRDYKDGLQEMAVGLRNGFQQKDIERLDATAAGIAKVAASIKDKGARADFLAGARASLVDLAENAGPKGQRAIEKVINKLDEFGLTKPPTPQLDVDDGPLKKGITNAERGLSHLAGVQATPKINADDSDAQSKIRRTRMNLGDVDAVVATPAINLKGNALSLIQSVQSGLSAVDGRVATSTIRINTIRSESFQSKRAGQPTGSAEGSTVPKTGKGYADRHLYLLADGEEVISNRRGQADRHRSLLKAINADRLAGGGTTGGGPELVAAYAGGNLGFQAIQQMSWSLTEGVDGIKDDLEKFRDVIKDGGGEWTKAMKRVSRDLVDQAREYDKLKESLTDAQDAYKDLKAQSDAFAQSVAGNFQKDPFGNGLAGFATQVQADTNDATDFAAALASAVGQGLDGPLRDALAASGDLNTAQQLAASGAGGIGYYEQLYSNRATATGALGQQAANYQFGAAIQNQTRVVDNLQRSVDRQEQFIKQLENKLENLPGRVEKGAENGTRSGNNDQNGRTATLVRTGGGGRR